MNPLRLVQLDLLMKRTRGNPDIKIGLLDGPVAMDHPDLATENIHEVVREAPGALSGMCTMANGSACTHGTFVAGILSASRESAAPAICPDCTLLVRPIFMDPAQVNGQLPSTTPAELAAAIKECIDVGARVMNLSVSLSEPSSSGYRQLQEALDYAVRRGVIVVAAAGNQGTIGSSVITRHPWVIPVVACDAHGRPLVQSNLSSSIGRRGLSAPGAGITSLSASGKTVSLSGTSAATPFVTGTIALLWSLFPMTTAAAIRLAITQAIPGRRATIVPPLLDALAGYQILAQSYA